MPTRAQVKAWNKYKKFYRDTFGPYGPIGLPKGEKFRKPFFSVWKHSPEEIESWIWDLADEMDEVDDETYGDDYLDEEPMDKFDPLRGTGRWAGDDQFQSKERDMLISIYSDMYKERYGIRPRYIDWTDKDLETVRQMVDELEQEPLEDIEDYYMDENKLKEMVGNSDLHKKIIRDLHSNYNIQFSWDAHLLISNSALAFERWRYSFEDAKKVTWFAGYLELQKTLNSRLSFLKS